MNNYSKKNMSYIRARDPSVYCNFNYSKVRKNLVLQYDQLNSDESINEIDHYQVYLRIKDENNLGKLYEIKDSNTLICRIPDDIQHVRNIQEGGTFIRTFKFSKIIDPTCNQSKLFDEIIKAKILSFINGHNCTLLSYGASGSGKTFTIVGTAEEPGIIPRSLEYLFRTLPTLSKTPLIKPNVSGGVLYMTESECIQDKLDRDMLLSKQHINMDRILHTQTYKAMQERLSGESVGFLEDGLGDDVILGVWVSFAEIYNENVYDLLKPEPYKGQLRKKLRLGYINGAAHIKELTSINVSSGLEAYLILQYGLHHLNYAATSVNDHSSRSHCIFTLKIAQASSTSKDEYVSVFNFCDLAGSERIKKTNNVGERLKESNSINTSLLVLGRCITLIRDNQKLKNSKLIPFRESKLTQLFQNALLGHEAVSMIVNINSSREMFDETQHVLQFSAIAKDVIVEQQVFKSCRNNRFSQFLQKDLDLSVYGDKVNKKELEEQLVILTDELQQQRLNNEEDEEHIITTFKQLLVNTHKHWEKICEDLKIVLANVLREENENANKKARLSVIVLNSSSEEDDNEDEKNAENGEEESLKEKIAILRLKLKTQQDQILQTKAKSSVLENTLSDQKRSCLEFKLKQEHHINSLRSKVIANNEHIKELEVYIESIVKNGISEDLADDSNKENVSIFGN